MDLNNKNVVYVGGCGGIGSATCKRLVQKKVANLVILDLMENDELIQEINKLNPTTRVLFFKLDLTSKDNIKKILHEVVSKIGHIDVLVNGVGICNEVDPERAINVNLLGLIYCTTVAVELMDKTKGNRGGLIVNIASVLGLDPSSLTPVYSASKAGVILYTRSVAIKSALDNNGVSLVVVCPGITRTGLLKQFTTPELSPCSQRIGHVFGILPNQAPDDCAKNIVEVIEINKNNTVYICDVGKIQEVPMREYWETK